MGNKVKIADLDEKSDFGIGNGGKGCDRGVWGKLTGKMVKRKGTGGEIWWFQR